MYLEYFGFFEKPFSITPHSRFLYIGKQQEIALSNLLYSINQRLGFSLLTGEVGTGKTTLSRALLKRLDDSVESALIVNPLLSVPELIRAINKDFGISTRVNSPQKNIELLNKFLLNLAQKGKNALVIIDEAQDLSCEALEAVRLLTNLETDRHKLLQIMLVGQPELLKRLSRHEMRQLDQRIMVRFHLKPFDLLDTMRYIDRCIYEAGGIGKVFFEREAFKRIHRETCGLPRLINIACDRSLMAAYVRESKVVDEEMVEQAILDWKGKREFSPFRKLKRIFFESTLCH